MKLILKKFNLLGIFIIGILYIVMLLQFSFTQSTVLKNAEKMTRLAAASLECSINGWLAEESQIISDAADFIGMGEWNDEEILKYFQALLKTNYSYASIYYGTPENHMINASGWKPPQDFDITVRPWYIKAVERNSLIYTDIFLNASKNAFVITIAKPVYESSGRLAGVVGGDVYLSTIVEKIANEKHGKSGFSFLLDSKGNIIAHPRYSSSENLEIRKPDSEYMRYIEKILAEKSGYMEARLNNTTGILAFTPLEGVDWYLASFISKAELIQENNVTTYSFVLATSAALVMFGFFVFMLNRHVKKPIMAMEESINFINVESDSSYRLPEREKDVMVSLTKTINSLLDKIETYLAKMKKDEEKVRQLNESLRESEERWQFALNGSGDGVWDWNLRTGEVFFSPKWREIYELEDEVIEFSHAEWEKWVHPEDFEYVMKENYKHFRNETPMYTSEYRIITRKGKLKWILARGRVVSRSTDGEPLRMVGTHSDITERKLSENKIKYLSFHDSLTGLYNRAYFEEQLKRIDQDNIYPVSLILGDANGLKVVNDAFGHEEGDKLLNIIANIFRMACKNKGEICRIGGDEFAIIMQGACEDSAFEVVEAIKQLCEEEHKGAIKPSIAIGVSAKLHVNEESQTIFRQAENRMYKNKLIESKSARSSIISSLRTTLVEKTHETEEHSNRLKDLSIKLGNMMNLHENLLNDLELLAILHDIGKVAIPDYILDKPGTLNDEEWDIMKKHSEIGYRIAIASSELSSIADGILCHHERWDGKGYNQGLKGEEIPLISRIVAVVDSFDAMTNDRPYRKAIPVVEALDELKKCSGKQFDPEIVEMFIHMIESEL
ncbi:MAG: HD domain-containing phosphohydrolase [Bacillota bacterium]